MIELYDSSGMLTLRLHPSLLEGLSAAVGITTDRSLTERDAERFDEWASTCDNPSGQRADLARSVAGLLRVTGALHLRPSPPAQPRDFWDLSQ